MCVYIYPYLWPPLVQIDHGWCILALLAYCLAVAGADVTKETNMGITDSIAIDIYVNCNLCF